ncbi:hypothetical protein ACGFSD_05525 [Streptomyces caniferus]|uniref:hypothetical protein n=1 Tax=Streptomyces caniferus TaxID=285557 RepID=UPI0037162B3D
MPKLDDRAHPSWYTQPLRYDPEDMDGLPWDQFVTAVVHVEGAREVALPGSTWPWLIIRYFSGLASSGATLTPTVPQQPTTLLRPWYTAAR